VVWCAEVVGELPDGAEVGLLGALAQAGELKLLLHSLTESCGHVQVLSQRCGESASAKNLGAWPELWRGKEVSENSGDQERGARYTERGWFILPHQRLT
jgi:hypothetical protein